MRTQPDADRYSDLRLELACPKCQSGGLIPLEQLDQMLFCRGCQTRFCVEPQGLVELPEDRVGVQVRTHSSDWEPHQVILTSRSKMVGGWLLDRTVLFLTQGRLRWAVGVVLLAAIIAVVTIGGRSPAEPAPLVLPDSLEERAQVFTEALVRRDMPLMIRLTDPAQHRALRIWLAHGSQLPKPVEDRDVKVDTKVVQTVLADPKSEKATLRVQVLSAGGKPMAIEQAWAQNAAGWYFQPVRLRSPPVAKGPVRAYTKPGRR
ncbi:MAG TPA: hypothetical protein VMF30_02100 [Pirellulales bacterium]|nr:hypothetical protein [Pirellulales bacterium]